jgi:4-amino-4-deoxy-L-arabinose transferase-like glycosyltransferase
MRTEDPSEPAEALRESAAPAGPIGGADRFKARWLEPLAVVAACALFLLLAWIQAKRQTYPYFDDVTYLELGNRVKALGGPLGLLRALFAGTFEEANRHPLYLGFLSLVARYEPGFHRDAQALTVALGLVALLSCWWAARRWFGPAPAAVLALLLASSRTFVACSSREGCEPVLVAVWAQAIACVLSGLDARRRGGLWPWLLAGVWSGLAYLTKGTGLFLPVSLALTFLLVERARAVIDRRAWAYAVGFVAAAAPLFVRNVRRFGSPIHNQNLDSLWIDRLPDFAEVFAPQAHASLPHGFVDYLHHLTPGALLHRVVVGVGETLFILAESMAPAGGVTGGALHVAAVLVGAAATVVALRFLWRATGGFTRAFLFLHGGWTFLFLFIFSVNGGNTRYFLPLAATVLAPALAARVVEDVRRAGSAGRSRWAVRTAAVVGGAILASTALRQPPLRQAGMEEMRDWLLGHLRPGDVYVVDARTHFQLQWLTPNARQVIVSASWRERPVGTALLLDYLRRERARFVVLDGAARANMASSSDPAGRRYLFYDRLPLEPGGSLPLRGFPGGLRPAYVDPGSPRRWIVLETPWGRAAAPPPSPPATSAPAAGAAAPGRPPRAGGGPGGAVNGG